MAFIQCSLIGTALDWYTNLDISNKQQLNSFVQLFKKQFSSQKTAYYAQVEAMSLMKKDNETVRHFALRVQQLVKKGWCNESASTINLKSNQIFTKGLPKNLKDFAHKRVTLVSTLLEPYRSPYRNNSNYRYNSRSRYRSRSQSQGNSFRRYNYPNRSPSTPRDYRSRSRTPSKTDNKIE